MCPTGPSVATSLVCYVHQELIKQVVDPSLDILVLEQHELLFLLFVATIIGENWSHPCGVTGTQFLHLWAGQSLFARSQGLYSPLTILLSAFSCYTNIFMLHQKPTWTSLAIMRCLLFVMPVLFNAHHCPKSNRYDRLCSVQNMKPVTPPPPPPLPILTDFS